MQIRNLLPCLSLKNAVSAKDLISLFELKMAELCFGILSQSKGLEETLDPERVSSFAALPKISGALRLHTSHPSQSVIESFVRHEWNSFCASAPQCPYIDFSAESLWPQADIEDGMAPLVELETKKIASEKLHRAVELLRMTLPVAHELVMATTKIFHIRGSSLPGFGSSSNYLRIGSTVLRNIHFPEVSAARIADFLLHESIHHLLHMYEVVISEFACLDAKHRASHVSVVSPWSRNEIAGDSFAHAIFVWFTLWNFWTHLSSIAKASSKAGIALQLAECVVERRRAQLGFVLCHDLNDILQNAGVRMPQDFLQTVSEMQSIVRSQSWLVTENNSCEAL